MRHYAKHFNALEINTTYYGIPKLDTVQRWHEETPGSFHFIVKLHRTNTHQRTDDFSDVRQLLDVLKPLHFSGKLKGLLAQFPASFHFNDEAERYLGELAVTTEDVPLFVEFRHRSWNDDEAVALCREHHIGWVASDLPPIRSLIPPRPAFTAHAGYVRFHGRNKNTWYHPELGNRYDWDYSEDELKSWYNRLKSLSGRAEITYLFFNNCHMGQAIRSANRIGPMIENLA